MIEFGPIERLSGLVSLSALFPTRPAARSKRSLLERLQEMAHPRCFILSLIFCWYCGNQTTTPSKQVAEPQYINSFSAVDSAGKLIELEHQTVTKFHSKMKPLPGYATVKVTAEFKPAHSSIRLPTNAQFVVLGRSVIDPATLYELRILKSTKDHREILTATGHGTIFNGSGTSNVDEGAVPIRFENYGSNSYKISPQHPLAPGEYALAFRGTVSDLYCFGVDAK